MISIIQAAGWPIWFLLLASIISVALIIERGEYRFSQTFCQKQSRDLTLHIELKVQKEPKFMRFCAILSLTHDVFRELIANYSRQNHRGTPLNPILSNQRIK